MNNRYNGQCHCGAIGFVYTSSITPERWSVRACQCRFCRAHDALSTSEPDGRIEFFVENPEMLQRYRFGLHTADFLLCRNCGVYVGALIEIDYRLFGIINTHTLTPVPTDHAAVEPVSYDSEDTGDRISRREQRWAGASWRAVSADT
jgi:hypothetical protein